MFQEFYMQILIKIWVPDKIWVETLAAGQRWDLVNNDLERFRFGVEKYNKGELFIVNN